MEFTTKDKITYANVSVTNVTFISTKGNGNTDTEEKPRQQKAKAPEPPADDDDDWGF